MKKSLGFTSAKKGDRVRIIDVESSESTFTKSDLNKIGVIVGSYYSKLESQNVYTIRLTDCPDESKLGFRFQFELMDRVNHKGYVEVD